MKTRFAPMIIVGMLLASLMLDSPAQSGERPESSPQIPVTARAVWIAIDQQTAGLSEAIRTGAFGEVDHRAYAIRDLAAALQARSGSLSSRKLAEIKRYLPFVATLARRLDASGDAKDRAGKESNFRKLRRILSLMRGVYPADAAP